MMADSDPFSGIPLSPPPLAEINTDSISLTDVFSVVLSNTNNISQPALRALANFIATKVSSLTNTEIARLSDDKIARLIDAELSLLSEEEINRLIVSHVSGFCSNIGSAISSFFASAVAIMINDITPSIIKQNPDTAFKIFQAFLLIGSGILSILISNKIEKWNHQRFLSSLVQESLPRMPPATHVVPVAAQKQQLIHSWRPSLVRYSLYMELELPKYLRIPSFVPYSLYMEGLNRTGEQRHIYSCSNQ